MRAVTIVLVRHSKSCANHVRHVAGTEDRADPLVAASQHLRDPALSAVGERMARAYGPQLRRRLEAAGVDVTDALIGSSPLRRAKQTAGLLFGTARPHTFMHFGERGRIPENTAADREYTLPDWHATLRDIAVATSVARKDTVITVGHGSFLRSVVWPLLTQGRGGGADSPFSKGQRVHNLDVFVIRGAFDSLGRFTVAKADYLPYTGAIKATTGHDQCQLPQKIATHARMTRYQRRTYKRKQQGGYVGMPLGYFRDGAQMQGTYTDATGTGLAGTSASWAREPLAQTGGFVKRGARLTKKRVTRKQQGGFAPSVMGAFVTNGMRFLPVAGYMGYKMWKNSRKAGHRGRGTRHRRN